jgi:hypothetical protein
MERKLKGKDFIIDDYDDKENLIYLKIFMNTRHLKNRGDKIRCLMYQKT